MKFMTVSLAGKVTASIFRDSQGVIKVYYLKEGRQIKGSYHTEKCNQNSNQTRMVE